MRRALADRIRRPPSDGQSAASASSRRRGLGHPSVANGDPPRCQPREALVVRRDDDGRPARRREPGEQRDDVRARWRCRGCPVGSSARITRGSLTSARAIATRCCSPPESCDGQMVGAIGEADLLEQRERRGRAPRRRRRRPARSPPATLSSAVSVGIRLNCWKTKPNVAQPEIGEGAVAERAEVLALEAHRPLARRGRARRAAGAASSCPSRSGPRARRARPARCRGRRRRARARSRGRAGRTASRRAPRRALGRHHSTCLSASAGRMRAARQPPAAPATRPPRIATRSPSRRT